MTIACEIASAGHAVGAVVGFAHGGDARSLAAQRASLVAAGCTQVVTTSVDELLASVGPADTVVITKFGRLGLDVRGVVDLVTALADRGVALRVLDPSLG